MSLPPTVCIIGKKKSGKTTTSIGLVRELVGRGHVVMTAKHGHGFALDTAGTDSWRHRHEGGAHRVVMAGEGEVAVVGGWGRRPEPPLEEIVARWLDDAGVVVAEGFKTSGMPKIEVYRRAAHREPIYGSNPARDATYLAILSDVADLRAGVPVLDVDDPRRFSLLADLVEERVMRR